MLKVSKSVCILTTQAIMKLLKSKEAAAAVDVKSWPMVLDTGDYYFSYLHSCGATKQVVLKTRSMLSMAALKTAPLCLCSPSRRPPSEEELPDVQAPDPRDVGLPGFQCVHNGNLGRGQSMWSVEGLATYSGVAVRPSC